MKISKEVKGNFFCTLNRLFQKYATLINRTIRIRTIVQKMKLKKTKFLFLGEKIVKKLGNFGYLLSEDDHSYWAPPC